MRHAKQLQRILVRPFATAAVHKHELTSQTMLPGGLSSSAWSVECKDPIAWAQSAAKTCRLANFEASPRSARRLEEIPAHANGPFFRCISQVLTLQGRYFRRWQFCGGRWQTPPESLHQTHAKASLMPGKHLYQATLSVRPARWFVEAGS